MRVFMRLLTLLSPFRWWIALAIFLGCVTVASNIGLLGMAAYLIADAALVPLLALLTVPVFVVRLMGIVRPAARYAERLVSHDGVFRLLARLRTWMYSRLEPRAPLHLLTHRSGDLLARLVADIDELQNLYLRVVSPIIVALAMSLFTFGLFSIFSPLLAWTALAFLLLAGLGLPLLTYLLARGLGRRQLALRAEQKAQIVDSVQGIQDILAYGRSEEQLKKISQLDQALGTLQRRMARVSGLQEALNDLLMNLALWVLLALAIPLVTAKAIDGVYLAVLALLILASFEAIQPLAPAFQLLEHSLAAGRRLFSVADTPPAVIERPDPLPVPAVRTMRDYSLQFEHVSFTYGAEEEFSLHDVHFQVSAGSHVALVGPSGSGKSTLARLALRFWDPQQGTIRLNGQDIRECALDDLRGLISLVAQDTYLFNGTLRRNLLLARPGASESELAEALERAQLHEFVSSLPRGLDTWIGEQGLRLSGGERQRLAIARALLKDAPILILDEPTANLDSLTERSLFDTLNDLMQGRTVLLITHRLIAMERMDEIIVLDRGCIRERGTHSRLLEQNGLYRQLFELQSGLLTFTPSVSSNGSLWTSRPPVS